MKPCDRRPEMQWAKGQGVFDVLIALGTGVCSKLAAKQYSEQLQASPENTNQLYRVMLQMFQKIYIFKISLFPVHQ